MNDGESRRPRGVEVIGLTPELRKQAVDVLADAFSTEEITSYSFDPDDVSMRRRHAALLDHMVGVGLRVGAPIFAAVEDGRVAGVAVVRDPRIKIPRRLRISSWFSLMFRIAPLLLRHPLRSRRFRAAVKHPEELIEPYFNFQMLAVRPELQGMGAGGLLMEHVLSFARADAGISGIYLITGSDRKRDTYARRGCRTITVRELDGLNIYHMFWSNPSFSPPEVGTRM